MMLEEPTDIEVTFQCDRSIASQLPAALDGVTGCSCRVAERKNIVGEATAGVVVITLLAREIPMVILRLRELIDSLPIRRIRFGDGSTYDNVSGKELLAIIASKPSRPRKAGA